MTIDINNINNTALQQSAKNNTPAVEKSAATATQVEQNASNPDSDTIHITDQAQLLQQLQKEISQLPEIDNKKVEAVKKAITDGTYTVDTKNLAEKLLNFEDNVQASE